MTRTLALGLLPVALASAQAPTVPIAKGSNVLYGRILDMGDDTAVGGAIVTLTALTMDPVEAERFRQPLDRTRVVCLPGKGA